jgi:hypothetical protein
MTSKRHAKPTAAQLSERTYRRVLAIEKRLARDNAPITEPSLASLQAIGWGARKDINDLGHAMHAEFATIRTLTDHCARLLREKETLQRIVTEMKDSATYMSHPLKLWEHTTECTTANSARIANGEFRQCICGADEWKEKLAANVYNADFKP